MTGRDLIKKNVSCIEKKQNELLQKKEEEEKEKDMKEKEDESKKEDEIKKEESEIKKEESEIKKEEREIKEEKKEESEMKIEVKEETPKKEEADMIIEKDLDKNEEYFPSPVDLPLPSVNSVNLSNISNLDKSTVLFIPTREDGTGEMELISEESSQTSLFNYCLNYLKTYLQLSSSTKVHDEDAEMNKDSTSSCTHGFLDPVCISFLFLSSLYRLPL